MKILYRIILSLVLLISLTLVGCEKSTSPIEPQNSTPSTTDPEAVMSLLKQLDEAGANAEKMFSELSIEQQQAVIDAVTPTEITEENTTTPIGLNPATAKQSCWYQKKTVTGRHKLGWRVCAWIQEFKWCGDDKTRKITSFSYNYYGETYVPLVEWSTNGKKVTDGGKGYSSVEVWSQGRFRGAIGGLGFATIWYPWIKQRGYWYGNYSVSTN